MPSTPIQPTLDLLVKGAMADAEAAFLKKFLESVDPKKTLGEILREIVPDAFDYEGLDHAQTQAVKGLLSIRVDQIKLDKKKRKAAATKKKKKGGGRKKGSANGAANSGGSQAAE